MARNYAEENRRRKEGDTTTIRLSVSKHTKEKLEEIKKRTGNSISSMLKQVVKQYQ